MSEEKRKRVFTGTSNSAQQRFRKRTREADHLIREQAESVDDITQPHHTSNAAGYVGVSCSISGSTVGDVSDCDTVQYRLEQAQDPTGSLDPTEDWEDSDSEDELLGNPSPEQAIGSEIDRDIIEEVNSPVDGIHAGEDSEDDQYASIASSDSEQEPTVVNDPEHDRGGGYEEADDPGDADNDPDGDDGNELLYPGANITVGQSLLAILTFIMAHGLTGVCLRELLKLIAMHCPAPNLCKTSVFKFNKYFRFIGRQVLIFHYYCQHCVYPLPDKNSNCEICHQNQPTFFIEIPLFAQLQAMFKRPGFLDALQFRFYRTKVNESNIEDIYDGRVYKSQFDNNGILKNPHNLSFLWYTDGVAVFKSSTFSIWPLFLVINELPYKERVKQDNILLAGLWFGHKKPNPNVFLAPLHSDMEKFKTHGHKFQLPNTQKICVRGIVLCGVCDTPAKSTFLCMKHHNGYYGCSRCKCSGERYNIGNNSSVHVYPYTRDLNLRNNDEVAGFSEQAVQDNVAVYGIKGPTLLYSMVPNMILSTGIDVMHAVFSGVAKLLVTLWFDTAHGASPYSLSRLVRVIDARLNSIAPPGFVHRMPRSIEKTLAQWKSFEFKVWFLYYSIPTLLDIMEPIYMDHHIQLVSAIFLLSQRSISHAQVEIARDLLHSYVSKFQELYGVRYIGINVHMLLHLPDVVLDLGPTWVYSCYFLEDLNGKIAKLVHGTNHAGLQVCSMAMKLMHLSSMISTLPENSVIRSFCENLTLITKSYKVAEEISPGVYVVGTYRNVLVVPMSISVPLRTHLGLTGGRCSLFHRLRKKGVLYSAASYTRMNKRNSMYASFMNGENHSELCAINDFVKWLPDCDCREECTCEPQWICIATVFNTLQWHAHTVPNVRLSFMNKVVNSHVVVAFPISSLECSCFYFSVNGSEYIAKPINPLEVE